MSRNGTATITDVPGVNDRLRARSATNPDPLAVLRPYPAADASPAAPLAETAPDDEPNTDELVSIYDMAQVAFDAGERADPDLVAIDRFHLALNDIELTASLTTDECNRLVLAAVRETSEQLAVQRIAAAAVRPRTDS
jgi:hypothetical protein